MNNPDEHYCPVIEKELDRAWAHITEYGMDSEDYTVDDSYSRPYKPERIYVFEDLDKLRRFLYKYFTTDIIPNRGDSGWMNRPVAREDERMHVSFMTDHLMVVTDGDGDYWCEISNHPPDEKFIFTVSPWEEEIKAGGFGYKRVQLFDYPIDIADNTIDFIRKQLQGYNDNRHFFEGANHEYCWSLDPKREKKVNMEDVITSYRIALATFTEDYLQAIATDLTTD